MSIILSPPGSGKTTWINNNKNKNIIFEDADIVFKDLHDETFEQIPKTDKLREIHYRVIDIQLLKLKNNGRHIIGSLFWDIIPDAIVIIDTNEHKKRVSMRNDLNWDKVQIITNFLLNHANKYNIPIVTSFEKLIQ